jgi:hypothetical protein
MKTNIYLWYVVQFSLEKQMFQTNFVDKIETYFMFNNCFPIPCCLWDYVENIVDPDTPQMTIRRISIACWIINATNVHSVYVIIITFPLQKRLHEKASMLRYKYIAFHVYDCQKKL